MLFKIPIWCGVLITGLSTLTLLLLQQYGVRKLEFFIAFLVFTIAVCFFVELGNAKPKASEVVYGPFVPQLKGNGATKLAISLLGAMVMPHNLFLHSALVLSRKIPRSVTGRMPILYNRKWICSRNMFNDEYVQGIHDNERRKITKTICSFLWISSYYNAK